MESFLSTLKKQNEPHENAYRMHSQTEANLFDDVERCYSPRRRSSTIGSLSPMGFERMAGLTYVRVN